MRFLVIAFAALAIGAQCRSITPSNATDAENGRAASCVHRGARVHRDASQAEESAVPRNALNFTDERKPTNAPNPDLIASYEENFAKLAELVGRIGGDKNNVRRENQLESLVERFLAKERSAELDNVIASTRSASETELALSRSVNDFKNLLNTVKELDIVYQNGEIIDEHIRIKRTEGCKGAAPLTLSDHDGWFDNFLTGIQRQLLQIRKYLNKLCKKHHATPTTTILNVDPEDDASPVSQSNVSIIEARKDALNNKI